MRVFWSDRDGNAPPPEALLHLRGFDAEKSFPVAPEWALLPPPKSYRVLKRTFLPTFANWKRGVETALDCIRRGEIQKVVLGRLCVLELAEPPDPFAIAAALREKGSNAFVFCTESFVGASPERLFRREGRHIWSEAMAGTRPRGALQQEFLESVKDLRELKPVQQFLQEKLGALCQGPLTFTSISVHQTPYVQHLYSQCSGTLREEATDADILGSIHPTPALCGAPAERARALIRECEPFERGLFGGAIGWQTPKCAEWAVGIRSCKIQGNTATLFSGTGIVEGSDPKEEWEELNHKLKAYDGILDH